MAKVNLIASVRFVICFWMAGFLLALAAAQADAQVVTYNGPADYIDVPVAIATDSRGCVIVTGYSAARDDFNLPGWDIVIIKYAANGTQKWAFRYDGDGLDDTPYALIVDSQDNIYVSGTTKRHFYNHGNWSYNWDSVVIRIDAPRIVLSSMGNILQEPASWRWAKRFDNGVDNPNGWVADDAAIALAMGKVGNVDWLFVTGTSDDLMQGVHRNSILTMRLDPRTGDRDDAAWYSGPGHAYARGMVADTNGHIFIIGQTWDGTPFGKDFVTLRYSNGNLEPANGPGENWPVRYDGYGLVDDPVAIKVKGTSIYVTGTSYSANNGGGFMTLKYNSAGTLAWESPAGLSSREDRPTALTVDSAGNVYVTGVSDGGAGYGLDFLTLKYDANGNGVRWWTFDGQVEGSDLSTAIGVDGSDRVYVAGYTWDGSDFNYLTMRLNMNGGYHWKRGYDSGFRREDSARAMTVTASGIVYVTGQAQDNADQSDNILTRSYRWDGEVLW